MKRIVLCCDGTWNRLDAKERTNVAKLSEAILGTAYGEDGVPVTQMVYHLDGVGAGRGTGRLAQAADRLLGGAFGWGLDALIEEGYRFLVLNYERGDEIYLFGFSRGAYCARSFCGLIRRAGIVERRHAARIRDAMALYRAEDGATVGERARRFRARYSGHVSTLPAWAEPDEVTSRERHAPKSNPKPVRLRLAYLGVWDTVGALGVPKGLLGTLLGSTGFMGELMEWIPPPTASRCAKLALLRSPRGGIHERGNNHRH
ncbi:phospholipase effector Tle1 domain-containing protein [Amaricoccus sp. W119]|uniref:phospholipase effector Tle1 domain-containing protein n=1 Tax=Amaricoccus sp. W119 TaxID=3391833 RepID=UPI0039A62FA8